MDPGNDFEKVLMHIQVSETVCISRILDNNHDGPRE